jgi:hypothetical protein
MTVGKFPKIWAMGHRHTHGILNGPVEITEKVDGSQFSWGKVTESNVFVRSKNHELPHDTTDKLFQPAVQHILKYTHLMPAGVQFYGETLRAPKHNVLKYDRTPRNHIALFGVKDLSSGQFIDDYEQLENWAALFSIDVVPLIANAVFDIDQVLGLLERKSYLGGTKIEGIVIKNYDRSIVVNQEFVCPIQCAKYVSEEFKESMGQRPSKNASRKLSVEELIKAQKSEARWRKAIQHLKEDGLFEADPRIIGALIKAVQEDWTEEDKQEFLEALWGYFKRDVMRILTLGLPEWFKELLARGEFDD